MRSYIVALCQICIDERNSIMYFFQDSHFHSFFCQKNSDISN